MNRQQQRHRQLAAALSSEFKLHLEQARRILSTAATGQVSREDFSAVLRSLHSLKGASRLLGSDILAQIAHRAESHFIELQEEALNPNARPTIALQSVHWGRCRAILDELEDAAHQILSAGDSSEGSSNTKSQEQSASLTPPTLPQETSKIEHDAVARVQVQDLMMLLELSARVNKNSNQIADLVNETCLLPVDPREWTDKDIGSWRNLVGQLTRASHRLSEFSASQNLNCEQILTVPARDFLGGFGRMVRELSAQQKKSVEYRSEGLHIRVELTLLQLLLEQLPHLLSNAVHHGIETPEQRALQGKSASGLVELIIETTIGHLFVRVRDDGRGTQLTELAERAKATLGGEFEGPSQELPFVEGLSSLADANLIAGRGLGLSAVRSQIRQRGGELTLTSPLNPQGGTLVEIRLPHGSWSRSVLVIRAAGQIVALPSNKIRRLASVRRNQAESVEGIPVNVPHICDLLDIPSDSRTPREGQEFRHFLLFDSPGQEVWLEYDQDLGTHQMVVHPLPEGPWPVKMLKGAGEIDGLGTCLVYHPEFFTSVRAKLDQPRDSHWLPDLRRGRILVVDDSAVTRLLLTSALEEDYEVFQAVHGNEAMKVLQSTPIDLVLTDVQMPVMDGIELLRNIRNHASLRDLPVVILTSMNQPQEQQLGLDYGANAYLLKQEFDRDTLTKTIERWLTC